MWLLDTLSIPLLKRIDNWHAEQLGHGGFSEVTHNETKEENRIVAVKQFKLQREHLRFGKRGKECALRHSSGLYRSLCDEAS
jgi:hypothetical protein